MLARDTTYGDALFSPFLSIVVIIVVNQRTGNSTGFQSEEIGCNMHNKFQSPEKLLVYIEKPRVFGTQTVSNLEISFHNWYDSRKEVLSVVEL